MTHVTPSASHDSEFGPDFVLQLEDPEFIRDPLPTYRWLRNEAPAYAWPPNRGVVFSRYRDVRSVYTDRRLTMNIRAAEIVPQERWPAELADYERVFERAFFRLGPSDHATLRRLVNAPLSPSGVEYLRTKIQRKVDEVLDRVVDERRLNLLDYTQAFLYEAICDALNIPESIRADLGHFCHATFLAAVSRPSPEQLSTLLAPMPEWLAMLRSLLAERREHPQQNDLLSTLIAARDGEARLGEADLIGILQALIIGGLDNTTHAICYAVYTLLQHPEPLAEVRERPALLKQAIDETLRFDNFVKGGVPRFCLQDMELLGVPLRKGQMVHAFIAAAHHDPEAFPDPERFDIHRDLTRLLAFGAGPHFCMGAALGRMSLEATVGTLLRRYPSMKLATTVREYQPNPFNRALARLDLTL